MPLLEELRGPDLGSLLRDLAETPAWGQFFQRLRELRQTGLEEVLSCNDWGDVRKLQGVIETLDIIGMFPGEVRGRAEELEQEHARRSNGGG